VNREHILDELQAGVFSWAPPVLERNLRASRKAGIPAREVLQALTRGVDQARENFRQGGLSIPEFLVAVDVFRQGASRLRPRIRKNQGLGKAPGVVIGVVEGDVHDLGKNIVAGVLDASGYRVFDLGRDVRRDAFLDALKETAAPLVALSSMMSTPLDDMRELILWVRRLFPDTGILVGGAALDELLAMSLGADGYAESAGGVPEEAERVLALRGKSRKLGRGGTP